MMHTRNRVTPYHLHRTRNSRSMLTGLSGISRERRRPKHSGRSHTHRERERERDQEAVEESGTERKREMRFTALVTLICVILSVQSGVHATNFLFVQTATGATLNGTLTMTGVTKDVTYFSDRPVRVAGIMSTEEFLAFYEPNRTFYEVRYHTCALHILRESLRGNLN